jgi:hypothetical protein
MKIVEVLFYQLTEEDSTAIPANSQSGRTSNTVDQGLMAELRNAFTPDGRVKLFWDLGADFQEAGSEMTSVPSPSPGPLRPVASGPGNAHAIGIANRPK